MLRQSCIIALSLYIFAPSWLGSSRVWAHCQIPCGIYDDPARIKEMREHIVTITKSVTQIQNLAGKRDAQSINQLVRWINNKDDHAEKIIRLIADYFLAQKVKPLNAQDKQDYAKYLEQLARHHAVIVAAMSCKQHADLQTVKALSKAVDGIQDYWAKP